MFELYMCQNDVTSNKKMGYDINRFEGQVDEELICPICSFILEDPVQVLQEFDQRIIWLLLLSISNCIINQAPDCEHAFCNMCINEWLKHQSICPIDRTSIQPRELKPVPRILKNLLSKLRIKCDHAVYGSTRIYCFI